MNAIAPSDQFSHWREAVASRRPVETEPGNPRSGYYRLKNDAIAIWREDNGELCAWRSGKYPAPTAPDAIDEMFAYAAPHPVAYEDFQAFQDNGRWPDEVEPVKVEVADGAPLHVAVAAELAALRDQAEAWISEIKAVKTQSDADKAGNYAAAFAVIEKRAEDARKAEKEPHLEAGRAVDAAWKPVVEVAGECKTWSKKAAEAYLIAERKRLADEEQARKLAAAKAQIEAERLRREAEAAGAPPPVVEAPAMPPPPVKAKAGTSGRAISIKSRTVHRIVDARAVLEFFAKMNDLPPDLMAVVQTLVNRMRQAGVTVPGVETQVKETVA